LNGHDDSRGGAGPDRRTELAEERTKWAQERTMLAKQRTFTAWVRTGLATLAVGFAGTRLLLELDPQWLIRSVGATLIAGSALIFLLGFLSYRKTFRKLKEAGIGTNQLWTIVAITVILILNSAGALILLFLN
jgi:putative membrane protein